MSQVGTRSERVAEAREIWKECEPMWARDQKGPYVLYDKAIRLLRDGDDDVLKGRLIARNAWVDGNQGRYAKALRRMEQAFPLYYRTKDSRAGLAVVICQFAYVGLRRTADSYRVILKHKSLLKHGLRPDQIADTAASGAIAALSLDDTKAAGELSKLATDEVPRMSDKVAIGWVYIARAECLALSNPQESLRYAQQGCRLIATGDNPRLAFGYMDGLALQFMQLVALGRMGEAKTLINELNSRPEVRAFTVPSEIKTGQGLIEPRGRSAAGVPMLQAASLMKQRRFAEALNLAKFELCKPWSNEVAAEQVSGNVVATALKVLSRRKAWHMLTRATMLDIAAEACIALGRSGDASSYIEQALLAHESLAKRGVTAINVGELQVLTSEPHVRFSQFLLSKGQHKRAFEVMERGKTIGLARSLAVSSRGNVAMQEVVDREFGRDKLLRVQEHLRTRPGTTAIEYAISQERGCWALVVTRSSIRAVKLKVLASQLESDCRAWRRAILARERTKEHLLANKLYASLISPLRIPKESQRIVACLDGPLLQMPFAALSPDAGSRLFDRFAVSLTPSLHALTWSGGSYARPAAYFANPEVQGLPPIPMFVSVSQRAAALTQGRLFQGSMATREAFFEAGHGTPLVSAAVHGEFDDEEPLRSKIHFAGGSVTGLMMIAKGVRTRILCLWSCEAGKGEDSGGEGAFGFAWASRAAGSETLVAPLWEVPEAPSSRIAADFFGGLRSQQFPSQALARAIKKERARTPEPFAWAGFQVYGIDR